MVLTEHPPSFQKLSPLAQAECDIHLYAGQYKIDPSVATSVSTLLTDTTMLSTDAVERHKQISKGLRKLLGEQLGLKDLMSGAAEPDQVQHALRLLKYLEEVHLAADVSREFISQLLRVSEAASSDTSTMSPHTT
jgi:hypothetical protein